jgi:hypothetical protein
MRGVSSTTEKMSEAVDHCLEWVWKVLRRCLDIGTRVTETGWDVRAMLFAFVFGDKGEATG